MGLKVEKLVKMYGENTVVNNLSFEMNEPGVYALLGRNGAGKTTTIRMMLGMLSKNGGEVLWNDKVLDPLTTNVGYLAEERGLYPKYTLMDQLVYFAKLRGMKESEAKKEIKKWSEKLELDEYLYPTTLAKKSKFSSSSNKPIKSRLADQLSKGNQQKIQLLSTLISNPELLILDEPLSGLDPVNADLFKNIIRECVEAEKYIIMSSHQMSTIEEFCSDITIMNRGEAVVQGNLNEIKKSYGRVNMIVKSDDDIMPYINDMNLTVLEKTPDGIHIKVTGEEQANELLTTLVKKEISVVKFDLSEPSLHEIFIDKVGDGLNE